MSSNADHVPRFDPQAAARMLEPLAAQRPRAAGLPAQVLTKRSAKERAQDAVDLGTLPLSLSDRGTARLFVRLHCERFRHVEGLGWLSWDGCRWKRAGGENAALWAAGEMAENMPDTDPRGVFHDREIAHHKRRTLSTTGMKALLTQAKASPDISVAPDQLDGDPYVLCTPAGWWTCAPAACARPTPPGTSTPAPPASPREAWTPLAGTASSPTRSATTPRAAR